MKNHHLIEALYNPVRRQIIELLVAHKEMCVGDIAKLTKCSQVKTSQQLMKLRKLDIVTTRKDKVRIYYSIENKDICKILTFLNK